MRRSGIFILASLKLVLLPFILILVLFMFVHGLFCFTCTNMQTEEGDNRKRLVYQYAVLFSPTKYLFQSYLNTFYIGIQCYLLGFSLMTVTFFRLIQMVFSFLY